MIRNIEDLNAVRDRSIKNMELRLERIDAPVEGEKIHILVCGVAGCASSGSVKIADAIEEQIKINGLENDVKVIKTGCFGL